MVHSRALGDISTDAYLPDTYKYYFASLQSPLPCYFRMERTHAPVREGCNSHDATPRIVATG